MVCLEGWNDSLNIGSKAVILGNGDAIDAAVILDAVNIMVRLCAMMSLASTTIIEFAIWTTFLPSISVLP